MLPVAIARSSGEAQHNNVRLEPPDDPHHIAENLVVSPFLKCFLWCLGETEIDGPREKLLGAIDSARWDPLESTCRHASLSIL